MPAADRALAAYFERRIRGGEVEEPLGYRRAFHKACDTVVLVHEASGIHISPFPVDLVEQPDPTKPPPGVQYLYVYLGREAFGLPTGLAQREPRAAWQALLDAGALKPADGEGDVAWQGRATSWEPAKVARLRTLDHTRRSDNPWWKEDFCVVLRVLAHQCRPPTGGEAVEVCAEDQSAPQMQRGSQLLEAAKRRDEQAVRALLYSKADPDFQDARGWSALHAACSVRPRWEVLRQLLRVGSPCLRSLKGELPCDIADAHGFADVAQVLKELMQLDDKSKHLPQAMSVLSRDARERLGVYQSDHDMAAMKGRRRDEKATGTILLEFALALMKKYPDADTAFKALDVNGTGTLSGSEFAQYSQQLRCDCDTTAVFKALDLDRLGDISLSEFSVLQEIYDEEMLRRNGE